MQESNNQIQDEEMKDFGVLFTCCTMHIAGMINCLKNNPDGRKIRVYISNSNADELVPFQSMCDGVFHSGKITDDFYIQSLIDYCNKNSIDIIIPVSSIDLEFMSLNKAIFEDAGILVSVMPYETLSITNSKIELCKRYPNLLPITTEVKTIGEAAEFVEDMYPDKVCCKLDNAAGGKGFAIIDAYKAADFSLFHRFGQKHYISFPTLATAIQHKPQHCTVMLQKYIDGQDYSISLLAHHGKIERMVGYVGYLMEFGAVLNAEIKQNDKAYRIAKKIVRELQLDGNIGLDFILKPNGDVVLLEINPRVNATIAFIAKAGSNMLYLRCLQLLGESIGDKENDIHYGLKMRKFYDIKYFN